ncbi:MAG: hypothetical protein AAF719_09940 [Pseudomonadota bacterium]
MELVFFGVLHVLVLVYWLGGDLGAFYTSRYLTLPGVPTDRRLLAAKIVGDVDMAPRFSLIFALPTGYGLAVFKGWIDAPIWTAAAGLAAACVWAWGAWRLHMRHGQDRVWTALDRAIRYALIATLVPIGAMIVLNQLEPAPAFIGWKLLLLAIAIGFGLAIRIVLKPLGPALAALGQMDQASQAEDDLRNVMARARPLVACIWLCLIAAAVLGVATPV